MEYWSGGVEEHWVNTSIHNFNTPVLIRFSHVDG